MPQIVLHLILLSNHKKSKKERRITEIFLQRIPFSLKNYFCLGGVWLSLLGTNAQVLLSARSPSLILRCAQTSRLCQGLPLWGSWREAPERASPAEAAQGVGLESANDRADFRKAQSKLTQCVPASVLALSVIASRCHLSQSERFWICRKVCLLEKAPTLGELDAVRRPERASPLPARLRVSFDQTYDKSQCRPSRRGGTASDWESYHLNPHFLKYRIRFPACQRAGFRLRWAARCHAWMAVYWGTR